MPSLLTSPTKTKDPLAQGTLNMQPPGAPFVITGLKAKTPGSTSAPATTIKPAQIATQQKTTGSTPAPVQPTTNGSIVPPAPTPPASTGVDLSGIETGLQNLQASLAKAKATNAIPSLNGTVGQLLQTAQGNAPIGQSAADIAADYGKQIADVGGMGARFAGGQRTTGTSPVAEGNAAVTAQSTAAEQQALASGESAALQGTQQQLTAQQQQEQAQAAAGGLQTPGNQFIQQAPTMTLIGADGQPVQQASQNPDGSYTNALTGAPLTSTGNARLDNAVANALQAIKAGAGYDNAVSQAGLSAYGPMGANALNNALPKGFNVNASNASAAAQANNINTTETAATSAASTAYDNAVQAVSKATGLYTAASGVASNLTSTLGGWQQNGQLTNLNQAINTVAGLTSSPQYAQFVAAITNTQAAYTAAFQTAGITPTQSTQNALQELNPNSSANAILSSLNQLSSDLHAATIVPAYQQQQTYAQQLGIK